MSEELGDPARGILQFLQERKIDADEVDSFGLVGPGEIVGNVSKVFHRSSG